MSTKVWKVAGVFVVSTALVTAALTVLQPMSGISVDVLELARLSPAIGAAITWLAMRRPVRALAPDAVPRKRWIAHTILGVAAGALFTGVLVVVTLLQGLPVGAAFAAGAPFFGLLVMQAIGAFAEEVGWRGALQPTLERGMSRLGASLVVGVVWGLWHWQAFARPLVGVIFLVAIVALSVLLGHLAGGTVPQRIATAGIVHWLVNVATMIAGGDIAALDGVTAWTIAAVVTTCVFMAMFIVATRRRARAAAAAR